MTATDTATQAATRLTRRAVWTVTAAATWPQPAIHVTPHSVTGGEGAAVCIGDDSEPLIYVEYAGGGWSIRVGRRPAVVTLSARGAEKALVSGLVYCLACRAR